MNYRTNYYRLLTQRQIPDDAIRNLRTAVIDRGNVGVSYLDKEDGKWVQRRYSFILKGMKIPGYALDYLKGITQGAVPEDVLKKIDRIIIAGRYLSYRYKVDGKPLFGFVKLHGVS